MSKIKASLGASGLTPPSTPAVWGDSSATAGVVGTSNGASGVEGFSTQDAGVAGYSDNVVGVFGNCEADYADGAGMAVAGYNGSDPLYTESSDFVDAFPAPVGVIGLSTDSYGVVGIAESDWCGVYGQSQTGIGVSGRGYDAVGVHGSSDTTHAVVGYKASNNGVAGLFSNFTIGGPGTRPGQVQLTYMTAARFDGHVDVAGDLFVGGTKGFKIDHPLDPANKTLKHAAVESPEMKTFYDGVARTDKRGRCTVTLPNWFCALNKDFRYQLTAIGAPCPNVHIAKEITQNHFTIAGAAPRSQISWQVTGIRQDAWANAYRMRVEEKKELGDRGRFGAPQLFARARNKKPSAVLPRTVLDSLKLQEVANGPKKTRLRRRR